MGFILQETKDKDTIKRMADLLMQGATLTDMSCPNCGSPLFRIQNGTLWCAKDQKKVVVIKEGEEEPKPTAKAPYDKLESTLINKIDDLQVKLGKTEDPEELQKLSTALSQMLDSLEKIQKMRKQK